MFLLYVAYVLCGFITRNPYSLKTKFHYAILLANQLASWFASTS